MNYCKCDCHKYPLHHHTGTCCENTGKIYINEDGTFNEILYDKILIEKYKGICPCCGGTGKQSNH